MSQYPSPYNPPTGSPVYGYAPVTPDVLAASRRAGLLMFVVGGITLLLGTCILAVIVAMPAAQFAEQMQQSASATGQTMPLNSDMIKTVTVILMAVVLVVGIVYIALGIGVRRGSKRNTIAGLLLTGLVLAFLGLQMLNAMMLAMRSPAALGAVLLVLTPLSLLVLLIVWLVGALKAQSKMGTLQQQYAAQYWQYQQNMQAYYQSQQQQGYATAPPAIPETPVDPGNADGPPA